MTKYDAVVLGGGFYGVKVALALHNLGLSVAIVEPHELLSQATTVNQARVHSGLHYPRFFQTALSAAKHYRRFIMDHASVIVPNRRHLYAIAKDSKTTPEEFEYVAGEIGAPIERVCTPKFFARNMVDQVYAVQEVSFDINKIRVMLREQLRMAGIRHYGGWGKIYDVTDTNVIVDVDIDGDVVSLDADYVFNCTYAQLDRIVNLRTQLKKEWTEVAICSAPIVLEDTDVTIMDGLYWSLMRYPPTGDHALTHVKHTPHFEWFGNGPAPYPAIMHVRKSNFEKMQADAARFIPDMQYAEYKRSLWTTRVVLAQNEEDDGRPILWEYAQESPRIISLLGSKFNSVYDAIDEINRGEWNRASAKTGVMRVGRRALVGNTGFVGSSLVAPGRFTDYSNSTTPLVPGHYDQIICTALKGTKWWANLHFEQDMEMLNRLRSMLEKVTTDEFILISTIDAHPRTAYSNYGYNRELFERWVKTQFPKVRIIRLPALFGKGLKKNILFDLLQWKKMGDRVPSLNPDSTYQWYPLARLWDDIQFYRDEDRTEVNVVTPPISVQWLLDELFPWASYLSGPKVTYDVQNTEGYVMFEEDVKAALRAFVEDECRSQS